MPLPILSPTQSADWDRRAAEGGIALETLMDAAGRAAAAVIAARFPERLGGGVVIVAGGGHNGGDGWVIARALHRMELPVFVAPLAGEQAPLTALVARRAAEEGVRSVEPDGPWPAVALVVDAILGTGAKGSLRPAAAQVVERISDLAVPVVAVDGPTGVDLSSGLSHGPAISAALTVTFGGLRRGHLLARDECGDIAVVDIGHPPPDSALPRLITERDAALALGRFPSRAHKGDRGRVVVVGGAGGMEGAIRLAGRAAFAAGAGLVHVVSPAETVAAVRSTEPDLQTLAHPFTAPLDEALTALLAGADTVVIGPGLGRGTGRLEFVCAVARASRRVVIDADGLNAFQGDPGALAALAAERTVVITPHPGEFARLFPAHAAGLELDPWAAATAAAAESGALVLLKGVPTVVAGRGAAPLTVAAGNPGLATGGSGDVLSGIAGTLLGQVEPPLLAAAVAAHAMGRAAEQAARRTTARSLRPMDVVAALPDLWRAWNILLAAPPASRPPLLLDLPAPQRW